MVAKQDSNQKCFADGIRKTFLVGVLLEQLFYQRLRQFERVVLSAIVWVNLEYIRAVLQKKASRKIRDAFYIRIKLCEKRNLVI
jgi:hypothetical protein